MVNGELGARASEPIQLSVFSHQLTIDSVERSLRAAVWHVLIMKTIPLLLLTALAGVTTAQAQLVFDYDFNASGQGWTGSGNWTHNSGAGTWQTPGYEVSTVTTLTSPIMTLNASGTVSGSFTHAYSFEGTYDGSRVEFTVDGGTTWNVIAKNLFTAAPYNGSVELNDWAQQIDGAVFTDVSAGFVTSTFTLGTGGESQRYESGGTAYNFSSGDELQFRFLSSWGDEVSEGNPNWSITSATFTASSVPEPASTATVAGLALLGFGLWRRHSKKTATAVMAR